MNSEGRACLAPFDSDNVKPLRTPKFCLSPNAKEFIPRGQKQPNRTNYMNSMFKNFDQLEIQKNVHNRQNLPSTSNSTQRTGPPINTNGSSQQNSPTQAETNVLDCTTQLVNILNENPGVFDTIQEDVVRLFDGFESNYFVLSNAIEIIFNHSIEKQNFRYMGAKLYQLIDSMVPQTNSAFKYLLKLKLNYHQQEIVEQRGSKVEVLRGTALFLAEMYMQLQNDGRRMKEIAEHILLAIRQLLMQPIADNVKCICFTLKLAGYELELDCPSQVSQILSKMQELPNDTSTQRVLDSVLNLRKNSWGRADAPNLTEANARNVGSDSFEPIFYGPDGTEMTMEESSFLELNMPNDDNEIDEDDFDPEMSGEMKAAFQNFLKEQQKS